MGAETRQFQEGDGLILVEGRGSFGGFDFICLWVHQLQNLPAIHILVLVL